MSHVDAIVELSANFQHLDALHDMNKSAARHQRNAEKESEEPEAKAVNLTVKSAEPDEDEMPGAQTSLTQLLKEMAEEPWQRLKWHDQNVQTPTQKLYVIKLTRYQSPESWERFYEHFGIDKGVEDLPELVSTMTAQQWLDMISSPRYDYTTKSYREMTFPQKGVKDPKMVKKNRSGPFMNGTTGYIDENGWEYVDPDAPKEEGYLYETGEYYSTDEDNDEDEDDDEDEDEEDDEEDDSEWETDEEEDSVHSGDDH